MNLDGIEHQNGALSSRSQKGLEMSVSEEGAVCLLGLKFSLAQQKKYYHLEYQIKYIYNFFDR